MRPRLALFLVPPLLACAACARPPATPADPRPEIARVLDDFHDAAAHADEARYFAHFAPQGVFLGTDAAERWDVPAFRAYAHPHFAKGKAWSFHAVRRDVAIGPGGSFAWFDEALATEKLGPARGSGVLVQGSSGAWLIAQYNLSITIPNDRFADVKHVLETTPPPAPRPPP